MDAELYITSDALRIVDNENGKEYWVKRTDKGFIVSCDDDRTFEPLEYSSAYKSLSALFPAALALIDSLLKESSYLR